MTTRIKERLTYANVMATIAVFLALGGGAFAAAGTFVAGTGVIHGCVPPKGGDLYVTKNGKRCPRRTVALNFYQKGLSAQRRWGNVLVAPSTSKVLATVGPFVLVGACDASGNAKESLKSTKGTYWVYGEDGSYGVEGKPGELMEVGDDEDSDEGFYAWSPSTRVSINGQEFNWKKGHGSSNRCEFQGQITQTS